MNNAANCALVAGVAQCSYPQVVTQCNAPPPAACNGPNAITTYADNAANCIVSAGSPSCSYPPTTTTCNTPPPSSCSGNILTAYNGLGTCSASGGISACNYTSTTTNCAAQGRICGADTSGVAACVTMTAAITGVDYPVIAHGGKLVITGTGFTGATAVTLGGVSQTFTVNSATQITLNALPDTVPLDTQALIITTPQGTTAGFNVTVIHLVINETDSAQSGVDYYDFVEVYTGLNKSVNLTGYRLVAVEGNGASSASYNFNAGGGTGSPSINMGNTSSTGFFVAGASRVASFSGRAVQFNLLDNALSQDNGDAIAIYQRTTDVPAGTGVASITGNLIDFIVYDTDDADDAGLLNLFYGTASPNPKRVQVSEGWNDNYYSLSRCNSLTGQYTVNDRLDGRVFKQTSNSTAKWTPGAANICN